MTRKPGLSPQSILYFRIKANITCHVQTIIQMKFECSKFNKFFDFWRNENEEQLPNVFSFRPVKKNWISIFLTVWVWRFDSISYFVPTKSHEKWVWSDFFWVFWLFCEFFMSFYFFETTWNGQADSWVGLGSYKVMSWQARVLALEYDEL